MNWAKDVAEFNTANGYVPAAAPVARLRDDYKVLRLRLMVEELGELAIAMHEDDEVEVADAICDLLYVVVGTAVEYGLGPILGDLFAEVHRSNMSKFDQTQLAERVRAAQRGEKYSGKVPKGPHYEPPRLAAILAEYETRRAF